MELLEDTCTVLEPSGAEAISDLMLSSRFEELSSWMLEVDSVTTQEDEDSWTDLEDQDDTCSTCSTTSQVSEDTTFDSDSIWRLVEDISVLLSLDDDSITDDNDCSTVEDDSTTDDEHCSTTEDDSMTAADDSVTTEEDSTTLEEVSCDDDTDSVTDSCIWEVEIS